MTWVGHVTRTEINGRKYSRIQDNNKTHMEDPGKGRKIILKFISKKYECKCVECTSCGQGRVQRLSILKVINVTSDTIYISRGYDNRVLLYLTVLISIYCRYKSTVTKLITLQISYCTLSYNISWCRSPFIGDTNQLSLSNNFASFNRYRVPNCHPSHFVKSMVC